MAKNFQHAENIRTEKKSLKQARYFHHELRKMVINQSKEDKVLDYTGQLANMNNRIEDLEKTETIML